MRPQRKMSNEGDTADAIVKAEAGCRVEASDDVMAGRQNDVRRTTAVQGARKAHHDWGRRSADPSGAAPAFREGRMADFYEIDFLPVHTPHSSPPVVRPTPSAPAAATRPGTGFPSYRDLRVALQNRYAAQLAAVDDILRFGRPDGAEHVRRTDDGVRRRRGLQQHASAVARTS